MTKTRTIVSLIVILVAAAIGVSAAAGDNAEAVSSGNQLTGTWQVTVTRPPLQTLTSLQVFTDDGSMIEHANDRVGEPLTGVRQLGAPRGPALLGNERVLPFQPADGCVSRYAQDQANHPRVGGRPVVHRRRAWLHPRRGRECSGAHVGDCRRHAHGSREHSGAAVGKM